MREETFLVVVLDILVLAFVLRLCWLALTHAH